MPLTSLVELLASREAHPREVVEAYLERIDRLNPRINAFVELFADEALGATERPQPAPLYGAPITIKDSFDVAGKVTRTGSLLRQDARAAADSTAAARLRKAGGILLGKSSTPEFLMNYETDNHFVGPTRNPWDLQRTAGGSSGGEAAAIAAGCSAGGIGSDGGGSIREPAHFCGIAGLKPTPGRCPAYGHWPEIAHPAGFMGVGGPMARTAADVRLLFQVLAGHDPRDPFSVPIGLREGHIPTRAALVEFPWVDTGCRHALQQGARLLVSMGVELVPFEMRLIEEAHDLWWFFFTVASADPIRAMIAGRESDTHWTGTELIGMVDRDPPTLEEYCANMVRRDRLRATLLEWMEHTPLLLAPGFGVQAFPHRQRDFGGYGLLEAIRPVSFVNLFGLPAVTVPIVLASGLPAGVQLIGRPYSEESLLEAAVCLETARGPFPMPPLD